MRKIQGRGDLCTPDLSSAPTVHLSDCSNRRAMRRDAAALETSLVTIACPFLFSL